jgi:hypothetical protein
VRILFGSCLFLALVQSATLWAQDPSALERAQKHYDSGVALFESGNKEQALVEFQLANEAAPRKENIFMIAQCEYHLGQLVSAREHYQAYLAEETPGELADLARLRIEAINRRPGVFAINTVPDDVNVRIEGEGQVVSGQAPNEFRVKRGRYSVTVSKPNFASETRTLSIEVAETKPLFFKLEPIPAHLTIHTQPSSAALFVRGNRTQNPYVQDVPPGSYEIYAEAPYFLSKRESILLGPGETREVSFPLTYVQRSGRPELIGFWTGMGAVSGGLAVLTQSTPESLTQKPLSTSTSILAIGMLAGGLGLGVLSSTTPLVPNYIRDNQALFRIGTMWIGDVEGASLAMGIHQSWTATFLGGLGGLTAGAFAGWWLDDKSPNYGRVALIQSAALLGAAAGAIAVPASGSYPVSSDHEYQDEIKQRLSWGLLTGLNVGLATGLAMAYLPDQRGYGPSWQRVMMVDLAGVTGAVLATAVEVCSRKASYCADNTGNVDRRTARFALVGTGLGVVAGWLLTMNYDRAHHSQNEMPMLSLIPLPGAVPVETTAGTTELLPGLTAHGRF